MATDDAPKNTQSPAQRARIRVDYMDDQPVDLAGWLGHLGFYGEGPIEDPETFWPALEGGVRHVNESRTAALVNIVIEARSLVTP